MRYGEKITLSQVILSDTYSFFLDLDPGYLGTLVLVKSKE